MPGRERYVLCGVAKGQKIAKNYHCIGTLGDGGRKGIVQFLGLGRLNCRQRHAKVLGCARYFLR